MIKTSEAFRAAIVGSPRQIEILAVVDISDPDLTYQPVTSTGLAAWSRAEDLHDKNFDAPKRYATLERNRWLLDGSYDIFPDDLQADGHMGVATDTLSGEDGSFAVPVYVQLNFSGVSVLQACSVFFSDDPQDGVPEDFTVEVIQGGTAYHTATYTGNTATEVSFSGFTVRDPDAIRVTCTKWSLPGRRMRIVEIIPGAYEQWTNRMLATFTATQQGDVSGLSVPYGSVTLAMDNRDRRFEPRSKSGLFQSIEARQGIQVYIGARTADGSTERVSLGVFYQYGDGWKTGDNSLTMQWYLVDIIGLLTDREFIPPAVLPTTLGGWLAALAGQLGDSFKDRWHVDPNYTAAAATVGSVEDVQGKKCGDILKWVCQATGTWPRADAETGDLTAEPLWSQGNKLTLDNLTAYPTLKSNEAIAALIFTLNDGASTQYVVSGNSTTSSMTVSIKNPFIKTASQALTAAKLILANYGGNVIETTGRGDPSSEIGDVDSIWLDESQATSARRVSQTFNIQDGVLQGCQSKFIQPDGSYLYDAYETISESGSWTAPAGVTRLRVVIGQGGQGGARGYDGTIGGSGNIPGSGVTAEYGETGLNGSGGKVWFGIIEINPQQVFTVHLGAGGAASDTPGVPGAEGEETTFGAYSSAGGQLYDNGYTDIANGQVFARTGVKAPLPGTADGGAGGQGGEPGQGHWEQLFWPDGRPRGWDFYVTKRPGKGKPGVAGATGFVMVTWDRGEETT